MIKSKVKGKEKLKNEKEEAGGFERLCRDIIYLAIDDLHRESQRHSALAFFLSDNFRQCSKVCGYNYKSIIEDVYQMSKLSDIQRKVRGQQIIKQLTELNNMGSENNVISIGRGSRKTH